MSNARPMRVKQNWVAPKQFDWRLDTARWQVLPRQFGWFTRLTAVPFCYCVPTATPAKSGIFRRVTGLAETPSGAQSLSLGGNFQEDLGRAWSAAHRVGINQRDINKLP
jgi:hypothetical protein